MFLEMSNPPTKCHDSTENHEGARYIVIYDPLVFILSLSLSLTRLEVPWAGENVLVQHATDEPS